MKTKLYLKNSIIYVFLATVMATFAHHSLAKSALTEVLEIAEVLDLYPQQNEVFGIPIIATKRTPSNAIKHAMKVMTGYLDNNRDGKVDNPLVHTALLENYGAIVLGKNESDWEDHFEQMFEILEEHYDDPEPVEQGLFSLFANETNPRNEFDASLEEILHLITHIGYGNAYPDTWGLEAGTDLAKAMDKARSGHFKDVPNRYPNSAWFTYDDDECDYGCQMVEYTYWAITSYMGIQASRSEEIEEEWKLATQAQFKAKDKKMLNLILDPKYSLPLHAPLRKTN